MSLYRNINNKKKRIAAGSGEKMRKPGQKGAPTAAAFKAAAKTAKKKPKCRAAEEEVGLDICGLSCLEQKHKQPISWNCYSPLSFSSAAPWP